MPAWNPLLTLPPRRRLGALTLGLAALYLALGGGFSNDVKTATAPVDSKREQYANGQDGCRVACWTSWISDARAALLLPGPNPKALQFHGGKLARIVKWHVACYEQLKHGRDVPRPALRR